MEGHAGEPSELGFPVGEGGDAEQADDKHDGDARLAPRSRLSPSECEGKEDEREQGDELPKSPKSAIAELLAKLLTYEDQSHDIQLPEESDDHSSEADLTVGSLDAIELAAPLGSARSNPKRREEGEAAD